MFLGVVVAHSIDHVQAQVAVSDPVSVTLSQSASQLASRSVWRRCADLRSAIGLPAKHPAMNRFPLEDPLAAAMFHISLGQEVRKKWAAGRGVIPKARLSSYLHQRDMAILTHFQCAMRASEAAANALLGLANNTSDGVLIKWAIRAVDDADVGPQNSARVANLLVALLDHRDAEVAAAAFACLQRLLDAGFPTGEVAAKLAARAGSVRPVDLKPPTGRWSPVSGLRASPEKMPPLRWPRPPHDMPAQLITLSAVRGDMAMIGHLIPGNETNTYIQHLVLHCHWLASPWVAPEAAEQLFQRYSAEPALRREEGRHWPSHTGVHQDVIGAVTILVRILPKLQAMRVPFYDANLLRGGVGGLACNAALHRIACLQRSRDIAWLGEASEFRGWKPKDALRLWRYLGSTDSWTLAGCFAVAPKFSGDQARRSYVQRLVRFFPLAEPETELPSLRAIWTGTGPGVARLIARRAVCGGARAAEAVQGWLYYAMQEKTPQAEAVFELAIELGLSLEDPNLVVSAEQRAATQRARDVFLAVNATRLGQTPVPPGEVRGLLYAARRLPQWPAPLAEFAAKQTTHQDAATRRAAYYALTGLGASAHPVAILAGEAAFDVDADVRDLCLGLPWAR